MVDITYFRSDGTLTWRAFSYWGSGCPIVFPFFFHYPPDGRIYEVTAFTDDYLNNLYRRGRQSPITTDCRITAREVAQQYDVAAV